MLKTRGYKIVSKHQNGSYRINYTYSKPSSWDFLILLWCKEATAAVYKGVLKRPVQCTIVFSFLKEKRRIFHVLLFFYTSPISAKPSSFLSSSEKLICFVRGEEGSRVDWLIDCLLLLPEVDADITCSDSFYINQPSLVISLSFYTRSEVLNLLLEENDI